MDPATISVHFVNAALLHLQDQPARVAELLERHHIPPALLLQPAAQIDVQDYANLTQDAMLVLGDEQLGYGQEPQPLGCWTTMCQLLIHAETLGKAMARLARFYRLVAWGINTEFDEEQGTARFAMLPRNPNDHFAPYLYEAFLSYVHRLANWLIDRQIPLQQVQFSFSRPAWAQEYQRLFSAAPVSFDQPQTRIIFSAEYLALPIRQTPQTLQAFVQHPNLMMATQSFTLRSWYYRVQTLLAQQLQFNPTIADIARELHIHPHTLRSYLRREGFQFQEIKDKVRCDTALYLLQMGNHSVEATAHQTGFSEASAFIRAFRRWTGTTPFSHIRRR